MSVLNSKWFFRLLFLVILALVIYLLYTPFISYFFYPFDYREEVYYYSEKHEMDPYLIAAVINVESGFDPEAVSPKGACGLMQIMPDTGEEVAAELGINDFKEEMLFKPGYNLELGTYYLSRLKDYYQGNLTLALAAYNGGQGKVNRWLREGIWDGDKKNIGDIPYRETREYIRKVKKARQRYEQIYNSDENCGI